MNILTWLVPVCTLLLITIIGFFSLMTGKLHIPGNRTLAGGQTRFIGILLFIPGFTICAPLILFYALSVIDTGKFYGAQIRSELISQAPIMLMGFIFLPLSVISFIIMYPYAVILIVKSLRSASSETLLDGGKSAQSEDTK